MSLEQIIILAFVQGLTEFLPISSSGHLVLVPYLFGWEDQGLMMDVSAHVGSLVAVIIYFYKDVLRMFSGLWHMLRGRINDDGRLVINLIIATIPAVFAGLFIDSFVGEALRSVTLIAVIGIIFGLLLYGADKVGKQTKTGTNVTHKEALLYGLAQSLALINGVSRSGICMTAGRKMNYRRADTARFAFLMAIPTIAGAGILKGYQLFKSGDTSILQDASLMAFFSFIFGFCAIAFMMKWLRSSNFTPFVIYRIILGIGLITSVYTGFL